MSFAIETKEELSRSYQDKKCCQLAEIAGFLRVSASLSLMGMGKFKINIVTENAGIVRHYKKILHEYFGIEIALDIEEGTSLRKNKKYILTIDPTNLSEQILRETGMLSIKEGNNYFTDGIYEGLIKTKCCKKSYLRGIFMGSGSVNDPHKSYHLEIVCRSEVLANDLKKMINSFVDLNAKIVKRKEQYIVYMKNSTHISDLLALMGAHGKVLELEDIKIRKEVHGEVVRITNCDNANTDRTLDASQRHIAAIKHLEEKIGLQNLPPNLREVAYARLEHPEISIKELGELMDPPLKKSGINNRLKKIEELASKV